LISWPPTAFVIRLLVTSRVSTVPTYILCV
jgi:hypothetical protein